MSHSVIESGTSRSFPSGHKVLQSARPNGEVLILVGAGAAGTLGGIRNRDARTAIVIELGYELPKHCEGLRVEVTPGAADERGRLGDTEGAIGRGHLANAPR